MNEQERAELLRLKQRLQSLQHELDLLWTQTQQFEAQLKPVEQASTAPFPIKPMEITPSGASSPAPPGVEASATSLKIAAPAFLPPVIPPQPEAVFVATASELEASESAPTAEAPTRELSEPPPLIPAAASAPPVKESSFEMKLGKVWLVRIGIVMLLTALVFFGNYAYQNFISKLGAGGKLFLMYLGSGLLLGLGARLQRKQESLKSYAQVLFAGGLAAVYFTTYAAHHIANLKVIQSGVLDGVFLLAWAAYMAWLADRKKSELLAIFAVGLAYYTSIITNIGLFTLYSNLVLTMAGVFFFVRNRWTTLSFGSLFATYGGYTYWRFYVDGQWLWHLNLSNAGFQPGNLFLLGYWLLFTAAVFLSRHEKFTGEPRAAFLTVNNAAFFSLVVLTRLYVNTGSFWKLSLCFGAVLLGLAALAARRLAAEKIVINNYLTQGLVLVTVGFITYFTGLKLAIMLAAESVILLILADQRQNLLLRIGAYLTAFLAVSWAVFGMKQFDRTDLYLGASVGLLMTFNAFWARRHGAENNTDGIRPQPATFSALALVTLLVTTWNNTAHENLSLVLAVETVLLTVSFYALRIREITLFGQGYLVLAQAFWLWGAVDTHPAPPWWNPALLVAITLGLSHWWQHQRTLKFDRDGAQLFQGLYALATVGMLFFWLHPLFNAPVWLAFTSLLAVGLTVYGAVTRAWLLAACGQFFLAVSAWEFLNQLWRDKPEWYVALVPMASLVALSFGVARWFNRRPELSAGYGESILPIALVYRWAALLMSLAWVYQYIAGRERFWVLSLSGALVFWEAGWRKNREGLQCGAVLTAAGFWLFWFPFQGDTIVYWPNLLAILVLLGQQRLARHLPEHFEFAEGLHTTMIMLGGLSLWRFASKWIVLLQSDGFYLTVCWAVLALLVFVTGVLMSERIYRWLGLGVLGCALGRVVLLDVWKLDRLYQILSFMALGIVLLILGFIYIRYEQKIKEWL